MNALTQHNDLIPVIEHEIDGELQPCVDARELHKWLDSKYQFSDWIKLRIKTYGFVENEDFVCLSEISETQTRTGRKGRAIRKNYVLTLDTAKELSMVENNEQGRAARRYFINCEKVLRKTVFGLMNQFNKASIEFDKFCEIASNAGRTLSLVGKQHKPQAKQKLDELKVKIQPMLPLDNDSGLNA
ncbi:antA/AntB antirepressor family protein [Acinetobacter baumannii]